MSSPGINKALAKITVDALGCLEKRVTRLLDEDGEQYVDILTAYDTPVEHCNSYATLSLSSHTAHRGGTALPFGVELLGVCTGDVAYFPNVIATVSFCICKSGWSVEPGALFPGAVAMYASGTAVKHVLLASPFLWGEAFRSRDVVGRTVAWLMVVPVTEEEMQCAESRGAETLLDILTEAKVDFADIKRASAVW